MPERAGLIGRLFIWLLDMKKIYAPLPQHIAKWCPDIISDAVFAQSRNCTM